MPIVAPKIDVFRVFQLLNNWSLSRPPKGTSLHETASYEPSCFEIGSVIFAVVDNKNNKKLSYCWETVRRESMPRMAEMDVEMTT